MEINLTGKPLIMKPWNSEMDMEKEELRSFPIWVQLMLNIKYWEEKALFKIRSQIGHPLKRDDATKIETNVNMQES